MMNTDLDTNFEEITAACRTIFGVRAAVSPEFVDHLQLAGLKTAFRTLAKESHPDRSKALGLEPAVLQKKFQHIRAAYELLLPYIRGEKSIPHPPRFHWVPQAAVQPRPAPQNPHPPQARVSPQTRTQAATAPRPHATAATRDWVYSGSLPERPLRLGQYLFYTQHITWNDLISALVWQASHRPRLGEIALEHGLIAEHHLKYIHKRKYSQELWGEAAVRLHVISLQQLLLLLGAQRLCGCPLGRFFQNIGRLTEADLVFHVSAQQRHNLIHRSV